jgi:hypothetical protein
MTDRSLLWESQILWTLLILWRKNISLICYNFIRIYFDYLNNVFNLLKRQRKLKVYAIWTRFSSVSTPSLSANIFLIVVPTTYCNLFLYPYIRRPFKKNPSYRITLRLQVPFPTKISPDKHFLLRSLQSLHSISLFLSISDILMTRASVLSWW